MPLWGTSTADESKPKFLSRSNPVGKLEDCFATNRGWTLRHYTNTAKTTYYDELLVAVGNLAGTQTVTGLSEATITAVYFESASPSVAGTDSAVIVVWNELVNITANATLPITGSTTGSITCTASSAANPRGLTGVNFARFQFDNSTLTAGETLSIADATTITGTIVDAADTARASDKVTAAGQKIGATGSGTYADVTVVA